MNARLLCLMSVGVLGVLASDVTAAPFSVEPGTLEGQLGASLSVLPEEVNATTAIQLEGRGGYFFGEGLEAVVAVDARVWPLGKEAPASYGVTGNVAWYPAISEEQNLYLMAGGGGFFRDPDESTGLDSGFQPMVRGAVGQKISLERMGPVKNFYLTSEFHLSMWFEEETSIIGGISLGLSYFR